MIKSRRKRLFAEGEKEICERSSRRPKGSFFQRSAVEYIWVYVRAVQPMKLALGAKGKAERRGRTALLAGEGYSKPPAGATWTAAGGFALAGVTQERER